MNNYVTMREDIEDITNKKLYDIMVEGVRESIVNRSKFSKIILKLPSSMKSLENEEYFPFFYKVFDNIEYYDSDTDRSKMSRSTTDIISYAFEKDTLVEQAIYQNTLEEIIGPIHRKNFFFTETEILMRINAMHHRSAKNRKMRIASDNSDKTEAIMNLRREMRNKNNKNKKYKDYKFQNTDKNILRNILELYHIKKQDLHSDQIRYYFTRKGFQYTPFNMKHQIPKNKNKSDIAEYDYIGALEDIAEYNSPEAYYTKLLNKISKKYKVEQQPIRKRIDEIFLKEDHDIDTDFGDYENYTDFLCLNYVKYRPEVRIITIWGIGTQYSDVVIKKLEQDGNVYYVKQLELDYDTIEGIMFWLYDEFSFEKRQEFITKKMQYIGYERNKKNKLIVIVFDNINRYPISGQSAKYKTELRNLILEKINQNQNNKEHGIRGNDVIHVNDYHYQTVEYSKLFFNKNTLNMLKSQDRSLYLNESNYKSNLVMQTLRSYLYQNMDYLDIDRLIIFGGVCLYAFGIRRNTDIDSLFITIRDKHISDSDRELDSDREIDYDKKEDNRSDILNNESKLVRKIEYNFMDPKTQFPFADTGIDSSKLWRESWTEKNKDIFDLTSRINGPTSSIDFATDPKNYFYFQGLKVTIIEYEIIKKILIGSHDTIDLIMIREFFKTDQEQIKSIERLYSYKTDDEIKKNEKEGIIDNPISYTKLVLDKAGKHGKDSLSINRINIKDYSQKIGYLEKILFKKYDKNQISQISHLAVFKHIFPNITL